MAKPNKFFTGAQEHEDGKRKHFEQGRNIAKTAAIDPDWLKDWINKNGPYLYHGTDAETAGKIKQEGLFPHDHAPDQTPAQECPTCGSQFGRLPDGTLEDKCYNCGTPSEEAIDRPFSRSEWADQFLRPRSNHVYMGKWDIARQHTGPSGTILPIDLRKLQAHNINADEDAFMTGHYKRFGDVPAVQRVWEYDPPPDPDGDDPQPLGDWADGINLGNETDETHHSLENHGTVAHQGVIPPEAIGPPLFAREWNEPDEQSILQYEQELNEPHGQMQMTFSKQAGLADQVPPAPGTVKTKTSYGPPSSDLLNNVTQEPAPSLDFQKRCPKCKKPHNPDQPCDLWSFEPGKTASEWEEDQGLDSAISPFSKWLNAAWEDSPQGYNVYDINVKPEYRGQGYGSRFMDYLRYHADQNQTPINVTRVTNHPFFDWLKPSSQDSYTYDPAQSKVARNNIRKAHPNYHTGRLCYCGFDWTKQKQDWANRDPNKFHTSAAVKNSIIQPGGRPDPLRGGVDGTTMAVMQNLLQRNPELTEEEALQRAMEWSKGMDPAGWDLQGENAIPKIKQDYPGVAGDAAYNLNNPLNRYKVPALPNELDLTRVVPNDPLTSSVKTADKLHDFLMNPKSRPDLQTPEGQTFLQHLEQHYHNDKTDALMPWLTREWKKKRIEYVPDPMDTEDLKFNNQPPGSDYTPGLKYYPRGVGYSTVIRPSTANHWADFLQSNHPVRRQLGDVMQHPIHSFEDHVKQWNEAMSQEAHEKALQGGKVVHTTPDNYTIRQLTAPEELKAEGDAMGHCVGGYNQQVASGRSLIYSLRDPQGRPHATTEIEPTRWNEPDPSSEFRRMLNSKADHPILGQEHVRAGLQNYHDHMEDYSGGKIPEDVLKWQGLYNQSMDDFKRTNRPGAIPHSGNVVQIQGKGNEEPNPEYKQQLAHWFNSFPEEERPQWDGPQWNDEDNQYDVLDNPEKLYPHHFDTHHIDEYGLKKPPPEIDWNSMVSHAVPYEDNYGGKRYNPYYNAQNSQLTYDLALAHKQIPEMAKAVGRFNDEATDMVDKWRDYNSDMVPAYPDESMFENEDGSFNEEEFAQAEKEHQAMEDEMLSEHPHYQAMTDFNDMLRPHFNPDTGQYHNEIYQPPPVHPPTAFSKVAAFGVNPDELIPEQRDWMTNRGKLPRGEVHDFIKNPPPGSRIWRGEYDREQQGPPEEQEDIGMHWSLDPGSAGSFARWGNPIVWQGTLHDPQKQAYPRGTRLWKGDKRSLDWEHEVRLRPNAPVDVEGYWRPQGGGDRAKSFWPWEGWPHEDSLSNGWEFVPMGKQIPVSNRGSISYPGYDYQSPDELWQQYEKAKGPSDFAVDGDKSEYYWQHLMDGNPWGVGYGGPLSRPQPNPAWPDKYITQEMLDNDKAPWLKTTGLWSYDEGDKLSSMDKTAVARFRHKYGDLLDQSGHQLWFKPGMGRNQEPGRGFVHEPTMTVHTWPEGEGTHASAAYAKGFHPMDCANFYMRPNGVINQLHGPSSMLQTIFQADPRLERANTIPDAVPAI